MCASLWEALPESPPFLLSTEVSTLPRGRCVQGSGREGSCAVTESPPGSSQRTDVPTKPEG